MIEFNPKNEYRYRLVSGAINAKHRKIRDFDFVFPRMPNEPEVDFVERVRIACCNMIDNFNRNAPVA